MPEWIQVAVAVGGALGALGGIAGGVSLYTARATRRNIESETAVNLIQASSEVVEQIRVERDELIRHRRDCEDRLAKLERKVRSLKAP